MTCLIKRKDDGTFAEGKWNWGDRGACSACRSNHSACSNGRWNLLMLLCLRKTCFMLRKNYFLCFSKNDVGTGNFITDVSRRDSEVLTLSDGFR